MVKAISSARFYNIQPTNLDQLDYLKEFTCVNVQKRRFPLKMSLVIVINSANT